ncbi:MAG: hypothetical protein ACK4RK_18700 [Gemmataceae bacterium]
MALDWFVTWSTHGSWLPGDPRGFQTWRGKEYVPPPRRYAKPGKPIYDPRQYHDRWLLAKEMCPGAVTLTPEEQQLVLNALVEDINLLPVQPHILSVGDWHIHFIAQFGALRIRPTVGRLKLHATLAIPKRTARKQIWAQGCHMKSLPDEEALTNGIDYVRRHVEEGALIYEW